MYNSFLPSQEMSLSSTDQTRARRKRRSRVFFGVILILLTAGIVCAVLFLTGIIGEKTSRNPGEDRLHELGGPIDCPIPAATEFRPQRGMFALNQRSAMQSLYESLGKDPEELREAILYLQGGHTEEWYYSDTEREFRQEANFFYVSGFPMAGAELVLVADVDSEDTVRSTAYLFAVEPDSTYGIWNGIPYTLEDLRKEYDFSGNIFWKRNMTDVLKTLGRTQLHTLPRVDLERSAASSYLRSLPVQSHLAQNALANARAIKTRAELDLIALATNISAEAHRSVMLIGDQVRYEYQVAALFQQLTASCGGVKQAYLPISPSGPRTAVLHYVTNDQQVDRLGHGDGNDMILVDAGAETYHYVTDITRTWPANGVFTPEQRKIYDVVLRAQTVGIAGMVPGRSYAKAAQEANVALLEGLLGLGILQGRLADLLSHNIHKVFQPHGLGHLVGLTVHDAGVLPEMLNPPRNLEPGMVVTVEPGVYFIPHLLESTLKDPVKSQFLNVPVLERYTAETTALGGVRIEDMIEITPTGFRLMSSQLPREADDIERWINRGSFDVEAAVQRLQERVHDFRNVGWRLTREVINFDEISLQTRVH